MVMTGDQLVNMLSMVRNHKQAITAIQELEDFARKRSKAEGLTATRVHRGIVGRASRKIKANKNGEAVLKLLYVAQQELIGENKALDTALFDGRDYPAPGRRPKNENASVN